MRVSQAYTRPVAPAAQGAQRASAIAPGGAPPLADVTSVAGIPQAELTTKVVAAIAGLMHEVERLREELERMRKRNVYLEKLADQDALLPVANRRSFVRELSRSMGLSQRYGTPSTLIYVDVNEMKKVNDGFGHSAGDAVLEHIAKILLENTRETDVVGRLGGDEFAVLLQQVDETVGLRKAEELMAKIGATPLIWNDRQIPVSATCGACTLDGRGDAGAAIDAADHAMYLRKRARSEAPAP